MELKKDTGKWGTRNIKTNTRHYKSSQKIIQILKLYDIMNGFGALYRGTLVGRIMGKDSKELRRSWIQTVYAIYNSKNNLKH